MASDYVLYHTRLTIANSNAQMQVIHGTPNVRTGYGTARLKSIRVLHEVNPGGNDTVNIGVELINTNWIRGIGLNSARFMDPTALSKEVVAYEDGYNAELRPNSHFNITGFVGPWTPGAGGYIDLYVLMEIDYSDVPTNAVSGATGYPMVLRVANGSFSAGAGIPTLFASPDNLDPGVEYLLSEVRLSDLGASATIPGVTFVVLSGLQGQRGLSTIIPVKGYGSDITTYLTTSVKMVKQSYDLHVINSQGLSNQSMSVRLTLIASRNSV